MLKVRFVSVKPPEPKLAPTAPQTGFVAPTELDLFPSSGSGDLVVTQPAKVDMKIAHAIGPGQQLAGFGTAELIKPAELPPVRAITPPPAAVGTPLPCFSPRPRVPGML